MVPLLVGVVWSALEIWQIMSLRQRCAAPVASGALCDGHASPAPDEPYDPGQVAWGVEKLLRIR